MTDVFIEVEAVKDVEIVLSAVTGGVLADGIVENTDETYSDTVANGSTLVIPDINITKNDASVVTSPSAIDLDLRIIDPIGDVIAISTDAKAAFDLYDSLGDGLTDLEKYAMAIYIDREVANGNAALKDYERIDALSGNNSLVDYIGGKVATAVNAPTHDINGRTYNGTTQYVKDGWNPATDAVNYSLNDGFMGCYVKTALNSGWAGGSFFGKKLSLAALNGTGIRVGINDTDAILTTTAKTSDILVYAARITATTLRLIRNGVATNLLPKSSGSIPNGETYTGARNPTIASFFAGTISTKCFGSAIGFNFPQNNTNMRALLTGLGTLP